MLIGCTSTLRGCVIICKTLSKSSKYKDESSGCSKFGHCSSLLVTLYLTSYNARSTDVALEV